MHKNAPDDTGCFILGTKRISTNQATYLFSRHFAPGDMLASRRRLLGLREQAIAKRTPQRAKAHSLGDAG
jgi:hypothetical protein